MPQTMEKTVNSDAQASKKLRRPKTRVNQAASGIITTSEIR